MGQVLVNGKVEEATIEAVINRADGTKVDLGVISESPKPPKGKTGPFMGMVKSILGQRKD